MGSLQFIRASEFLQKYVPDAGEDVLTTMEALAQVIGAVYLGNAERIKREEEKATQKTRKGSPAECLREFPGDRARAFREYEERHRVHVNALADLALSNFIEMRDRVASPAFRLKKTTERALHRMFPGWYTPLYNMVTFTRIPYAEARRRAQRLERVLRLIGWILLIAVALFVLGVLWGPT